MLAEFVGNHRLPAFIDVNVPDGLLARLVQIRQCLRSLPPARLDMLGRSDFEVLTRCRSWQRGYSGPEAGSFNEPLVRLRGLVAARSARPRLSRHFSEQPHAR